LGVEDRGCGLGAEDLARVFEPFCRGEQARCDGPAGVGLGLAVAQRIAGTLDGTLDVQSQPGAGCLFVLRLPEAASPGVQAGAGCRTNQAPGGFLRGLFLAGTLIHARNRQGATCLMAVLNGPQSRAILCGCLDVHRRMAELEALITPGDRPSAFSEYGNDLSPTEAKVVQDYFARIRTA